MTLSKTYLHYSITGKVNAGGMGVVYKAVDNKLNRTVALKFLPEAFTQKEDARHNLLLEAQAAAQMDHPNIGTVYAIEETPDKQLFLVLAYYEGPTLAERLQQGPLEWREAVDIATQITRGLVHAHDRGIVHQDIKPGNVLLTSQGLVKILDFGLARALNDTDATDAGMAVGTMGYMSPERVRGQGVDQRADIWALGVVMYEALAGMRPFVKEGDLAATIIRIMRHEPVPLSQLRPDLPLALDSILAKALSKQPDMRYASAHELLADLSALSATPQTMPQARATTPSAPDNTVPITEVIHEVSSSFVTQSIPSNLPTPKSALIGRDEERTLIDMYLTDMHCRMVTLLGTGGIGKTRLAIAAAHDQLQKRNFPDGIYFVSLDALNDAAFVPSSVAETLELNLSGRESPVEQIAKHIANKRMLIVLDNYEHVIDAALLPADLLEGCPNLSLLITSRERLNVEEEWIIPLLGLASPDTDSVALDDATSFAAVELFMQRAKRVNPRFELIDDTLPFILRICALVRGHPLGLELAAAWVRSMPVEDVANEIQRNYDFLASNSRNLTARHRSIRAVFDYSWQLLNPQEQSVLRRLSVFRGSISREAYTQVLNASMMTLNSLADKSFLEVSEQGRYQHHPILMQYAAEKLAEHPDEKQQTSSAHAHYYLPFISNKTEQLAKASQADTISSTELELENIRAAWWWAADEGEVALLRQAVTPLRLFYEGRGLIQEGVEVFTYALTCTDSLDAPTLQGFLKVTIGFLRMLMSDYEQAQQLANEGLALLKPSEDAEGVILGLNVLGATEERSGNYQEAKPYLEEALALAKATHRDDATASLLGNLASVDYALGRYDLAEARYSESLALARNAGNQSQVVYTLNNLGNLHLAVNDAEKAQPLLEEGLEAARALGMQRLIPFFLANLGLVAYMLRDYEHSQRLSQEALTFVQASGERWFEAGLLSQLGKAATALQEYENAETYLRNALRLAWRLKDLPLVLQTLVHFAELRLAQQAYQEAATLLHVTCNHKAINQEDKDLALSLKTRLPDTNIDETATLNSLTETLLQDEH